MTIVEKVDEIKRQKDAYLLPSNLKENVVLLGVIGTLRTGSDTEDATAYQTDIIEDKTAYARGQKLVGVIPLLNEYSVNTNSEDMTVSLETVSGTKVIKSTRIKTTETEAIANGAIITTYTQQSTMATAIGLTADKIVSGQSILGVSGTVIPVNNTTLTITQNGTYTPPEGYTGYSSVTVNVADNIKLFSSEQEMEQHTEFPNGTLAIVIGINYVGTYRWNSTQWEKIGVPIETLQAFLILCQTLGIPEEEYTGLGGTEEQIEAVLDSIIGEGGN